MYVNEYIRLIKQLHEYTLLTRLQNGINLMICKIDVPAKYKNDCDDNDVCILSLEKLEILLNDTSEAFVHGLCLAYALLQDLQLKK